MASDVMNNLFCGPLLTETRASCLFSPNPMSYVSLRRLVLFITSDTRTSQFPETLKNTIQLILEKAQSKICLETNDNT